MFRFRPRFSTLLSSLSVFQFGLSIVNKHDELQTNDLKFTFPTLKNQHYLCQVAQWKIFSLNRPGPI